MEKRKRKTEKTARNHATEKMYDQVKDFYRN